MVNDISWLDNTEEWKNIKSIEIVERERIVGDKETLYYSNVNFTVFL